jgi:hypothetical protein
MATNSGRSSFIPLLMPDNSQPAKRSLTPDWFVQGVLTKVGDIIDRLTGRGWKPSSSLATSELIEKLKALLESEKRTDAIGREYVPHNIKLKMQWDKFSSDSEESLRKLENEMLTAMVDFINDNRYYTYSPIHIEVKPDYFTKGVKLFLSFDEAEEEREADIHVSNAPAADTKSQEAGPAFSVRFAFTAAGKDVMKEIEFAPGVRVSVGRTKENGLAVDDPSVSKVHASMVLNAEGRLAIADTGSTNGTFVDGTRIPYGKAVVLEPGSKLMLGLVSVGLKFVERPAPAPVEDELPDTASYKVGDFEFTQRMERPAETNGAPEPAPTESAIDLGQAEADINK